MIINLLSSPRNVSTALMYSFAHRGDVKVIDEPFYSYYLSLTGANHPGKNEIIKSQASDHLEVVTSIEMLSSHHKVLFIKNMAHHLVRLNINFLDTWQNVFLIRDPKQLIASFADVIPKPKQEDIGIQRQYELFEYLKARNQKIIVLDSGELLKNPSVVLSKLCDRLGLKMKPSMLQWKAGSIPEDGIWSKYWYTNVHQSTGFSKQKTSLRELPPHCIELYNESLPYYRELSKLAIKVR